ncbi:SPOR domain-containing protein [Streptomyces sp. KLMMK]|uniref:SPOR domain-containing protein n=1 Tax=Streptomyces TaxID=1883 RepID=UPI0015C3CA61|nr:SPOR domain-containing protein [Streptomyces rectiverticillatus]QLE73756.1 SPOR domain-containing protein [Streptomyces rectiverticillatus]
MTDSGPVLPWQVIRQEENGNYYRVGQYATRAEAEKVVGRLDAGGRRQVYIVERVGRAAS